MKSANHKIHNFPTAIIYFYFSQMIYPKSQYPNN